jgi:HK97 family phage major capsid protein
MDDEVLTTHPDADPVEASSPTAAEANALDSLCRGMERMADRFEALQNRVDTLGTAAPAGGAGADDPVAAPTDSVAERMAKLERRFEQDRDDHAKIIRGIQRRSGLSGAEDAMRSDDPARRFNLVRAVAGHLTGWKDWNPANPEKTIIGDFAQQMRGQMGIVTRDTQATFSGPLGGFLVPPEVQTEFIETLNANTVALKAGARVMPLTGSPASWPKGRGGATAGWTPELGSPTKSDVRFGQLMLTPHPLVCIVDVSEDLIFQSSGRATSLVQEDMSRAMGEALDLGILKGTDAAGQPLGLVNVPGLTTTDWTGADFAGVDQTVTASLDEMVFETINRNAYRTGGMTWLMHPLTNKALRTLIDADGRPILFTSIDGKAKGSGLAEGIMWDHQFFSTTLLTGGGADSDLIFGDFSQILVGEWGVMEVAASSDNGTNFELSQVSIKMRKKVDAGVRHIEAFEVAVNLTAP